MKIIALALALIAVCWNSCQSSTFVKLPSSRKNGVWKSISGVQSSLICCLYCQQDQQTCLCVNYNKDAGLCELVTEELVREDDTTFDPSWTMYYILVNISGVDIKSRTQPSQSCIYLYSPLVAIDGKTDANFWQGSCIHTCSNGSSEEWWMADFGKVYLITGIEILNREDCCTDHFRDYTIQMSEPLFASPKLCATYPGPPTGNPIKILCQKPVEGRFLKVVRTNEVVIFCEIDFF